MAALERLLGDPPPAEAALYIDMDSFFATAEQQRRPELRGKPVAVCPFIHDSTSVLAASIEAKAYGIRTGTNIAEAKRLCPGLILLSDDPAYYRDRHQQIMGGLRQTECQVQALSIDEAVLRVPGYAQNEVTELANRVKAIVRQYGGDYMSCSVGIASNQWLAKQACSLRKPDGLLQLHPGDLESFYSLMKLTDLTGISWRMARRLRAIGITTPLEFYRAPYELLRRSFGQPGERWYLRLRGYEVDNRPAGPRQMVGHQTTVAPKPAETRAEVLGVINQLAYKAAARLRTQGLMARSVSVSLRGADRSRWVRQHRHGAPFNDSASLYDRAAALILQWRPGSPIRRISLITISLVPEWSVTPSLLAAPTTNRRISAAIDQVEQRYGRGSLQPARQLIGHTVADRVGFGNAAINIAPLEEIDQSRTT